MSSKRKKRSKVTKKQLGLANAKEEDKLIWEVIEEIMKVVPEEIINLLPVDGSEQHDHYIYGTPKKIS